MTPPPGCSVLVVDDDRSHREMLRAVLGDLGYDAACAEDGERALQMLAERMKKYRVNVWLLNTGWTGGPYGVGKRFDLKYTRAMVSAIQSGVLAREEFDEDPIFGLMIPRHVEGVPAGVLHPESTWSDAGAYEKKARELASKFRANDEKFRMDDAVRAAGPRV